MGREPEEQLSAEQPASAAVLPAEAMLVVANKALGMSLW